MPGLSGGGAKTKLDPWTGAALMDLMKMSRELFETTRPARAIPLEFLQGIVSGGPEAERILAPITQRTRGQFGEARRQIGSQLPPGGALEKSLADLSTAEASTISQESLEAFLNAISQLGAIGFPEASTALGGLGQAAGLGAGLAGQRAALGVQQRGQSTQLLGDIAQALGMVIPGLI